MTIPSPNIIQIKSAFDFGGAKNIIDVTTIQRIELIIK